MKEIWFFGLGNPGEEYKYTKHNVGRLLADAGVLATGSNWKKNGSAFVSKTRYNDIAITFFKSVQYMNVSGKALREYWEYIQPEVDPIIILIQDDSDQLVGNWKLIQGGGSGGHKGVSSTISELLKHVSSDHIMRLKIGIRPENNTQKSETFVLSSLTQPERKIIENLSEKLYSKQVLTSLSTEKLAQAMTIINTK